MEEESTWLARKCACHFQEEGERQRRLLKCSECAPPYHDGAGNCDAHDKLLLPVGEAKLVLQEEHGPRHDA